ncbi:MAG TPA: preprotein translocase subunit SecY, partial [Geobacteraceae bacterium]
MAKLTGNIAGIGKIPELKRRILFTLFFLAVYRLGVHVPVPGVNLAAFGSWLDQGQETILGLVNMFSGGALRQMSVFALGIMPYISASIILQLLTVVVPTLERLQKEGERGRRKIVQYTRYGTVLLSVIQGYGMAMMMEGIEASTGSVVANPGFGFRMMTVISLTAGTAFIMWLGEQITERGIGNGMSLIIYAGIVVNFPHAVLLTIEQMRLGQLGLIQVLILLVLMVLVVGAIIFVERGHRRV